MIFPDVSVEDFLKSHPELIIKPAQCASCNGDLPLGRPFTDGNFVGLYIENCPHCDKTIKAKLFMKLPRGKK